MHTIRVFSVLVLILILFNQSLALNKITDADSSSIYFQLKSIHLDFTTILIYSDVALSADFEIAKIKRNNFGIQIGYNYSFEGETGFGVEKKNYDYPFHDINFLAFTSIGYDKPIIFQFLVGYAVRMSGSPVEVENSKGGLKIVGSFIFNFSKIFKMHIKYSGIFNVGPSAFGLGFSFGCER